MDRFIQFHVLTSYPPANLNRDMLGRPKTAVMGNSMRLRVSSQSLKRAWRTGEVFQGRLGDSLGIRTRNLFPELVKHLIEKGEKEADAYKAAEKVATLFGKVEQKGKKKGKKAETDGEGTESELGGKQLFFFTRDEFEMAKKVSESVAQGDEAGLAELKAFAGKSGAADVALFGRMLADKDADGRWAVEAACQVAHAISVHKVSIEEDDFTAVDDISGDTGAGHMGVSEFAAGLFYLYICIDRPLLEKNLGPNKPIAPKILEAFTESILTVSPTGKQNSFGSRCWASYCLAERGSRQPRALSVAYLDALNSEKNILENAVRQLNETKVNMDKSFWGDSEASYAFYPHLGEGSLAELSEFVKGQSE